MIQTPTVLGNNFLYGLDRKEDMVFNFDQSIHKRLEHI